MSSTFHACREATFKGQTTEYSVLEHISIPSPTEAYRRGFCASGADVKEATDNLDTLIDGWCSRSRGIFNRGFECEKVVARGPVQVAEIRTTWDRIAAFFGELFR